MRSALNPDDEAQWLRKLGSAANNRGWTLTEQPTRTPQEDQEMLHAAHASVHLWRTIGNDNNFALGNLLLGQVHALLGDAVYAMKYAKLAYDYFTKKDSDPWEVAIVHAVLANAAHCAGMKALHETHYKMAGELIAALSDLEEKDIVMATFRVVPKPVGAA